MKKLAGPVVSFLFFFTTTVFASGMINAAGATFPYPVYTAWAYSCYQSTGIKVNYQGMLLRLKTGINNI